MTDDSRTVLDLDRSELPAKVRTAIEIIESFGNEVTVESTRVDSEWYSFTHHWISFESIEKHWALRTYGSASLTTRHPSGRTRFGGGSIRSLSSGEVKFKTWAELRRRVDIHTCQTFIEKETDDA